jgi:4-amino-4-deoxy-L-arabinose transferase-like glycosyltransferase
VRLPAVIFGTVGMWAVYAFAARVFDRRVAFWAGFAIAAMPATAGYSFLMTIDAPLLCFWSLALYTIWRALEVPPRKSPHWWLFSVVAIGAGLLSKQMMLVFPVITAVFLLTSKEDRHWLKRPEPYLTGISALLMLLPSLWWNMRHEWITLQHTAHHFALPRGDEPAFTFLSTVLAFVGTQLALISPLTWILLVVIPCPLLLSLGQQERSVRFLLWFSTIPLAVFLLMSFAREVNANWPAVFYVAGSVLLAAWACGAIATGSRIEHWRRLFVPAVALGAVFVFCAYAFTFLFMESSLGGSKLDPTARLKGWRALSVAVERVLQRLPRPGETFVVATGRQYISELAFYLPKQPRVYRWHDVPGLVTSQYDLWAGPEDKRGWDGLIILKPREHLHPDLANAFASTMPLGQLRIPTGPAGNRTVSLYLGHSLQAWPR